MFIMAEGPLGAPRPFADEVLSINVEIAGRAPSKGPKPRVKDEIEQVLRSQFNNTVHSKSNMSINHVVTLGEMNIPTGNGTERGFEVEVEMEPDGLMTLEVIQKVEELVKDNFGDNVITTSVISV